MKYNYRIVYAYAYYVIAAKNKNDFRLTHKNPLNKYQTKKIYIK